MLSETLVLSMVALTEKILLFSAESCIKRETDRQSGTRESELSDGRLEMVWMMAGYSGDVHRSPWRMQPLRSASEGLMCGRGRMGSMGPPVLRCGLW